MAVRKGSRKRPAKGSRKPARGPAKRRRKAPAARPRKVTRKPPAKLHKPARGKPAKRRQKAPAAKPRKVTRKPAAKLRKAPAAKPKKVARKPHKPARGPAPKAQKVARKPVAKPRKPLVQAVKVQKRPVLVKETPAQKRRRLRAKAKAKRAREVARYQEQLRKEAARERAAMLQAAQIEARAQEKDRKALEREKKREAKDAAIIERRLAREQAYELRHRREIEEARARKVFDELLAATNSEAVERWKERMAREPDPEIRERIRKRGPYELPEGRTKHGKYIGPRVHGLYWVKRVMALYTLKVAASIRAWLLQHAKLKVRDLWQVVAEVAVYRKGRILQIEAELDEEVGRYKTVQIQIRTEKLGKASGDFRQSYAVATGAMKSLEACVRSFMGRLAKVVEIPEGDEGASHPLQFVYSVELRNYHRRTESERKKWESDRRRERWEQKQKQDRRQVESMVSNLERLSRRKRRSSRLR